MFALPAGFPVLLQDAPPVSPVLLAVIAILLIILFIWLLLRERRNRDAAVTSQISRAVPVAETTSRAPAVPVAAAVEDDLEIIEGIGPKIAGTLKQAGITSFAQLAATDPARIREILQAANLRLADPTSWPEQARLAANGDMTALQSLQDRLKAGR